MIYGSQTQGGPAEAKGIVGDFIISVSELFSGNHVASFKQSSVGTNGLTLNDSYILAAQTQKALLNAYVYGKESISQKIILPESLGSLELSPSGVWLAGGSSSGRLYVWDLQSGEMVFTKDAHYRDISHIRFSADETYLFTASSDGRVLSWSLQSIVQSDVSVDEVEPTSSWSDHSLPVTGLVIGSGRIAEAQAFSSSTDSTVRIWHASTGRLVTTFVLPEPVTALAVDPAERALYCGLQSGKIQIVPLYIRNQQTGIMEAAGGAGRVITITAENEDILNQHQAAVTALTASFDGTCLLSGDASGKVFSWDLPDRQVLRSLKQHRGPVSRIFTRVRKAGEIEVAQPPQIPLLKRTMDPERQRNVTVKIQGRSVTPSVGASSLPDTGADLKVSKLQDDLDTLYNKYSELKTIHEELWKLHVKSVGNQDATNA